MQNVVAGSGELPGDDRRESIVHEKSQAENGASDERYLPLSDGLGGVAQRFADVFALEIRVGFQDLVFAHAIRNHPHHRCHRYAKTTDGGHSSHPVGVHGYAAEGHFVGVTFPDIFAYKLLLYLAFRTTTPDLAPVVLAEGFDYAAGLHGTQDLYPVLYRWVGGEEAFGAFLEPLYRVDYVEVGGRAVGRFENLVVAANFLQRVGEAPGVTG